MNEPKTAIARAVEIAGGTEALGDALGISRQNVYQWVSGQRPVPAERCLAIERITGGRVRCEELRPDMEWNVIRAPAGSGDAVVENGAVG